MPEAPLLETIMHLNWAYKELITQDLDCFIFYGGEADEVGVERFDPYTKYPILYNIYFADSNPLLETDWTTFINPDDVSGATEGFIRSTEIEFPQTWNAENGFGYLYNCYKHKIKSLVYDVPVIVRKVKSLFTFKDKLFNNLAGIGDKPLVVRGNYPLAVFDQFASLPFTQRPRTSTTPCTLYIEGNLFELNTPIFIEVYFEPPDITGENSACMIDLTKYGDMLIEGACGDYEEEINSNSQRKERFLAVMKPKFAKEQMINYETNTSNSYKSVF